MLFLETTLQQQVALVSTATESQVKAFVEIAYNVSNLQHTGSHHTFLTYIGNQKHTLKYKKSTLKKYPLRFVRAINTVKDKLLELL